MVAGIQAFRGQRLTEARLARGLYKNALGDMVGITGTAIARYEDGLDKPQADRLDVIADKLGFPVEFFLQPEWPETLDRVFWRSRATETKNARLMTEQRMVWLCELFSFLERELDFPTVDIPDLGLPKDFKLLTPEHIEKAADGLRAHWTLRNQPIPDVVLALENAGIPVVNLEIPSDKQDGFFFRSEVLDRSFVGINTYNVSCARARYDAAHELGHALLHKHVTSAQSKDTKLQKLIEDQAYYFASAFLFPKDAFVREVGSVSLDYLSNLKVKWGMSIGAMIFRAFNIGLISDEEKAELFRKMTRRRWRGPLREPFDDRGSMPLEHPRMLRRGVEALLSEGIFAPQQLKTAIALPEREIEQLTGVHSGFFAVKLTKSLEALDLESGNVIQFSRAQKRS